LTRTCSGRPSGAPRTGWAGRQTPRPSVICLSVSLARTTFGVVAAKRGRGMGPPWRPLLGHRPAPSNGARPNTRLGCAWPAGERQAPIRSGWPARRLAAMPILDGVRGSPQNESVDRNLMAAERKDLRQARAPIRSPAPLTVDCASLAMSARRVAAVGIEDVTGYRSRRRARRGTRAAPARIRRLAEAAPWVRGAQKALGGHRAHRSVSSYNPGR